MREYLEEKAGLSCDVPPCWCAKTVKLRVVMILDIQSQVGIQLYQEMIVAWVPEILLKSLFLKSRMATKWPV